ncbi:hypothetical protein GCM10009809_12180 [Isoptericola hypogeus]|uniref:Uncharacterized protein n=2 Tax=Isoptericola hypogeus TaxID=300179 RepID=A0ABN2J4V6_9MICO
MIIGGTTFAIISAVVSLIYFMQPWRTCPDDDAPAGCPMLPDDAAIMTAALVVTLFATAVAIAGAASRRRIYF